MTGSIGWFVVNLSLIKKGALDLIRATKGTRVEIAEQFCGWGNLKG